MSTAHARFNGTLKKWNTDRGFGFVVAEHGDQDLFVHVSAFPRDGGQPVVGEPLSFEIELGKDGRKRAVQVRRPGTDRAGGAHHRRSARRTEPSASSSSFVTRFIAVLLLAALGWFAYGQYRGYLAERALAADRPQGVIAAPDAPAATPPATTFQCDGRQHCSQMGSCREAKRFLQNCPGMKMDGDNDGIPCEDTLCTGPFGG